MIGSKVGLALRLGSALILAAAPLCTVSASARDATEWQRIAPPLVLDLPRDHGAHPSHRTEWWYATGELTGGTGRRFGYQLTIFRQGLARPAGDAPRSRLSADDVLAAHLVLIDIDAGQRLFAERVRRAAGGLAATPSGDLDLWVEDWTLTRHTGDRLVLHAFDRAHDIGIDLDLVPTKPAVLHGEQGVSQKGPEPGNASAYMSWTRLTTTGAITFAGARIDVAGESWFDHEWGTSQLGRDLIGWDWFGLRLDDGRELMLYRLRETDGRVSAFSSGTLVSPDGSTREIAAADMRLTVLQEWTSPTTRARYPARWRLQLPALAIDVEIAVAVADCEIDARGSTGVIYWEGPVRVTGHASGRGYAELTGYAGSLAQRF